jgi:hypothetical protein
MNLLGEQSAEFTAGVKGLNEAHPNLVHVLATSHHVQNETGNNEEPYDWVLFTVAPPGAVWDHEVIGTPNIAGKDVTQESDIIQRPAPEKEPLDKLSDALPSASGAVHLIVDVALIALGVGILFATLRIKAKK